MLATCDAYRAHRHGSESPHPGSTRGLNPTTRATTSPDRRVDRGGHTNTTHTYKHVASGEFIHNTPPHVHSRSELQRTPKDPHNMQTHAGGELRNSQNKRMRRDPYMNSGGRAPQRRGSRVDAIKHASEGKDELVYRYYGEGGSSMFLPNDRSSDAIRVTLNTLY